MGQGFQRPDFGTDYRWLNTHSLLATTHSTVTVRHAEVEDVGFLGYFLSSRTGLELAVALVGLLGPCHSPRTSEILCSLGFMVILLGDILPAFVTKFSTLPPFPSPQLGTV